jgi:hypothetical protein
MKLGSKAKLSHQVGGAGKFYKNFKMILFEILGALIFSVSFALFFLFLRFLILGIIFKGIRKLLNHAFLKINHWVFLGEVLLGAILLSLVIAIIFSFANFAKKIFIRND